MEKVSFLLGSDPELMLRDRDTKELRSAIPIIQEGKGEGRELGLGPENTVLHDNVLIEFNTAPQDSLEGFVENTGKVLQKISKLVKEHNLELHLQSSADYPEHQLIDQEAQEFGCAPDYGAYEMMLQQVPADAALMPFRSAGGHLHIGINVADKKTAALLDDLHGKVRVVKALDILVGIPAIFIDKDPTAAKRRQLYGKAGSHRPKPYGLEYRACGPWWLQSPEHTRLVYLLSEQAVSLALDEDNLAELSEELGGAENIQLIINESRVEEAKELYEELIAPLLTEPTQKLVEKLAGEESPEFSSAWKLG